MKEEYDIAEHWRRRVRWFAARNMSEGEKERFCQVRLEEYVRRYLQVSQGNGDLRTINEEYYLNILSADDEDPDIIAYMFMSPRQHYYTELQCDMVMGNGGWRPVQHQHDHFEWMIVLDGMALYTVEGTRLVCRAGEAVLVRPGVRHVEMLQQEATVAFLGLSDSFMEKLLAGAESEADGHMAKKETLLQRFLAQPSENKKAEYCSLRLTPLDRLGEAQPVFERMVGEIINQEAGWQEIFLGLCKRLLSAFGKEESYRCEPVVLSGKRADQLFLNITAYIEAHNERASGAELAKEFHYTADHLSRIVKKHTGLTLSDYRKRICVQKAEKLLRETGTSISDIISYLGYSNRTYFYRIFREQYGMTPQKYRETYGKTEIKSD